MFRPKVTGLEHIPREGGAIIASNHVSFLDALMLPLVVPHRRVMFLTKVKYIDKPLLRWFLTGPASSQSPRMTWVRPERGDGRGRGRPLRPARRNLPRGDAVAGRPGCTGGRPAWPGSRSTRARR